MPYTPRKPATRVTPKCEDAGLFKGTYGQIVVEVAPKMHRNSRQDLVINGFSRNGVPIEVVIAGRRTPQAKKLEDFLKAGRKRMVEMAKARGVPAPPIDSVRCRLKVEGAWRRRAAPGTGRTTGPHYQLLAARWSILHESGRAISFGIQAERV